MVHIAEGMLTGLTSLLFEYLFLSNNSWFPSLFDLVACIMNKKIQFTIDNSVVAGYNNKVLGVFCVVFCRFLHISPIRSRSFTASHILSVK